MNTPKPHITDLSSHIFWDTDINSLDFESDAKLITHRVLEYGVLSDWQLIKKFYGLPKIKEIAVSLRTLDDVTLAFLCTIFHLQKTDFRCYRLRQSTGNSWTY
ncbi:hypothetical protein HYN59_07905 [Flavobacterium album]|uniref:DUF6922 domain-containing protein n=1 Tax=Flavobacterium album TaxID=2175091 RepID=A0A2S1QXE6_9FLAO|nr:hypothetical protein [Flavobacterium album]AWH85055.1 hypothetical protein HYN59_07905 [Flavobacterium album]